MLKIRLRRSGRKHEPSYRIVVAEETSPIQGKFIAQLGHYNPKSKALVLNKDEATDWMNKGAKPSNTVAKLMEKEKMKHKSIVIHRARKISAKELAAQKAQEEAEKAKREAEKEAAKEAWDKESQEQAAEHASADEKLVEEAEKAEVPEAKEETKTITQAEKADENKQVTQEDA